MVLPNEATKTVIDKFPDLKKSRHWEEWYLYIGYNDQENLGCCAIMTTLGRYVEDIFNMPSISQAKTDELKEIFLLIEFFLNEGDQDVQDAAATCFLENLINYTAWGTLDPKKLMPYLVGKESIAYCKAWDEFTGVKTEGLWD